MKIGDQKVQRTLKKTEGKGIASRKKGPWDQRRDQGGCSPGPPVWGLLQDSWERAGLTAPSPAKQGLSNTVRDLVAWSRREGNKDDVENPGRLQAPAEESWKLGCVQSWPDSTQPSWRGGLCERSGPSLYGGSHRIKQEDFSQKEKDPLTFHIIMAWWWWTPWTWPYLRSTLSSLPF